MLVAAQRAIALTDGRSPEDLHENDVLALAVVRLLEILGEAARGVSEEVRSSYPEVPWRQMIATRDRLVHGYFSVDLTIVWNIVRQDLPGVVAAIEALWRSGTE